MWDNYRRPAQDDFSFCVRLTYDVVRVSDGIIFPMVYDDATLNAVALSPWRQFLPVAQVASWCWRSEAVEHGHGQLEPNSYNYRLSLLLCYHLKPVFTVRCDKTCTVQVMTRTCSSSTKTTTMILTLNCTWLSRLPVERRSPSASSTHSWAPSVSLSLYLSISLCLTCSHLTVGHQRVKSPSCASWLVVRL